MPMYYFYLHDKETVRDPDGTELPDAEAARAHAKNVARELMYNSHGLLNAAWSTWSIVVKDAEGSELFAMAFSDVPAQENPP